MLQMLGLAVIALLFPALAFADTATIPPPICGLSTPPGIVRPGQPVRLIWFTEHAAHAYINQNIGEVALQGFRDVRPTTNLTYIMTVTSPQGSRTCAVQVKVQANPPTVLYQPTAMPVQFFPGQVYWAPQRQPYSSNYYDDGYEWYVDSPRLPSRDPFSDHYQGDAWYEERSSPLSDAFNSFGSAGRWSAVSDYTIFDKDRNVYGATAGCDWFGNCEILGTRQSLTPDEIDAFNKSYDLENSWGVQNNPWLNNNISPSSAGVYTEYQTPTYRTSQTFGPFQQNRPEDDMANGDASWMTAPPVSQLSNECGNSDCSWMTLPNASQADQYVPESGGRFNWGSSNSSYGSLPSPEFQQSAYVQPQLDLTSPESQQTGYLGAQPNQYPGMYGPETAGDMMPQGYSEQEWGTGLPQGYTSGTLYYNPSPENFDGNI